MLRLGIISDTHNYLDPRIASIFAGVAHILHAGDIGLPSILLQLESIAPVTAVSGNTDDPALNYRQTEIMTLGGQKFLLHHIVNPHELAVDIQQRIALDRPDVVIFGHTHKQFSKTLNETLFFNPGYAGKSRFGMERSVALLHLGEKGIRPEYFKL